MIDIKTKVKNESMISRFLAWSLIALGLLLPSLPVQAERTTTYYVSDALGSPNVAMDEQGEVLWRKSYLPYGKQGNVDPSDDKDTAYTGKKLDRDTGLIYFGARWYDPEAGRFTGVDPVGFVESNPQSFNRYAYVNNNPYRFIDPDGRQATTRADYTDLLSPNDPSTKIAERAAQIGETTAAVGDAVDDIASDPTTYVGGGTLKAATLIGKAAKVTKGIDPNKLKHIFGQERHNLSGVVKHFGSEEKAFDAIQQATEAAARSQGLKGVFETTVKVDAETVTVRGNVIDGVVKMGTAFIP